MRPPTQLTVDGGIAEIAVLDSGAGPETFICGEFRFANDLLHTPLQHVAKLNPDGSGYTPLAGGVPGAAYGMAVFDDGTGGGPELWVAGLFAGGVRKWNGATWVDAPQINAGNASSSSVFCLKVVDLGDGPRLYAGGYSSGLVFRLENGSWRQVGGSIAVSGRIHSLAAFSDSAAAPALFAVGSLSGNPPESISGIARWDGVSWRAVPGSPSPWLKSMGAFPTLGLPRLYVGLHIATSLAIPFSTVAAAFDGQQWTYAFGTTSGSVALGMALQDLGDSTGDSLYGWSDAGLWRTQMNGSVLQINSPLRASNAFYRCGMTAYRTHGIETPMLLVAARVTDSGGFRGSRVERYAGCPRCAADFDLDGETTTGDLFQFLDKWFAHSPDANLDGRGGVGFEDLMYFIRHFIVGC